MSITTVTTCYLKPAAYNHFFTKATMQMICRNCELSIVHAYYKRQ